MGDLNFMLQSRGGTVMPAGVILRGERLVLRPPSLRDAGLIALYASDARVASMLARVPHPYPPGAAEAFVESALKDGPETHWVMDYAADDESELVGLISLKDVGDGTGVIGYWVAPQLWGGGFASEATELVVEYARTSGFQRLEASVHQGNDASAKVLTKAGFDYIGESEQHSLYHKGMVPTWSYELVL